MKPFNQFIISNYSWDPESLTASFCYSFDNEEQFIEKIDFTPLKNKENFSIIRNMDSYPKVYIIYSVWLTRVQTSGNNNEKIIKKVTEVKIKKVKAEKKVEPLRDYEIQNNF